MGIFKDLLSGFDRKLLEVKKAVDDPKKDECQVGEGAGKWLLWSAMPPSIDCRWALGVPITGGCVSAPRFWM